MKQDKIKWGIVWGIISIGIFLFYNVAHPLHIFTVDDWRNIVNDRYAYPYTGIQNPGKILPETIFPLIAELARWFVYPFTNDFIGAITLVSSIVVTILLVIYFYQVCSSVNHGLTTNQKIVCLLIFVALHFNIYKNSQTMLTDTNMTDLIHYVVTYLFNVIAVGYFMKKQTGSTIKPWEILLIYLCIFSNMFQSIILVTYVFFRMLRDIIIEKDKSIKNLIKVNLIWIITLIMWIADLIFEKNGNRANTLGENQESFDVIGAAKSYIISFQAIRTWIIVFAVLLCMLAVMIYIRKNGFSLNKMMKELLLEKQLGILIAAFVITSIYMVLLDGYINEIKYLERTNVYNTILIFPIIIIMWVLKYVIQNIQAVNCILPIILYIMLFQSVFHSSILGSKCLCEEKKPMQDYVIQQLIEADQEGLKEMTVLVPKTFCDDASRSWLEITIPEALFRFGVVSDRIKVKFVENM